MVLHVEIRKKQLYPPNLDQLCALFTEKLTNYYEQVQVLVVDCPDLTKKPFHLTAEGLNNYDDTKPTCIADIGGVPNLVPFADLGKPAYDLINIGKQLGFNDKGFIIGACCGPHKYIGVNSELVPNIYYSNGVKNIKTRCSYINKDTGDKVVKVIEDNSECNLLGNVYYSEGKRGKVLKIVVKGRKSLIVDGTLGNLMTNLRTILVDSYGQKPVSLAGVVLLREATSKIHIMPDFSATPLLTDTDVDQWLKYFQVSAPITCLSVLHSADPGLDLRMEHTHCFTNEYKDSSETAGHFHGDLSPETVVYEAYFRCANEIVRVDAPKVTHQIGRD